ncbi:autoinducer 2 ABC transporter substrate-binding protein [Pseudonocardia kunmingensis]|uniref:Monosaccharide ABC transporter substrate-binding protein (CUT2 family) n=1 Tax=Pseudonocardia kunmingensis TaxID=630975 RepID=A0A543CYH8_9PSEU|nr:autoinducer 2 ABC transporter substrate-binding protein [Pseudonocardia kunmingensis]TQM02154.1 monosaccharide ABC transporter substrate-binding protein (CUT2 family) [Pseudonocardia kunmingensis]
MRKMVMTAGAMGAALVLAACGSGTVGQSGPPGGDRNLAPEDMRFVNVVKLVGVGWFDRMEQGVQEFAAGTGIDATQTGADDASPEKQVKVIQDLIAQRPTAIGVVPNSPEALEATLERARDQGILVVTHEASNQENVDADVEAFDNRAYGAQIVEGLASCMGGSGQYAAFVGNLTAETHMEWVEGGLEHARANHPGMQRVVDPIESKEDESVAYERAKELLATYPDLKGFQGSAGTDVAGIARAVQEAGLTDQVCVMGTSIPSVARKYLEDGSIDKIFFWDPAQAGKAMMTIAQRLASGEPVEQGTNLGIPGYESLTVSPTNPKAFYGDAAIEVDRSNIDAYPF